MNPLKWKLHWQILAALILAFITGYILHGQAGDTPTGEAILYACNFVKTLFLNGLMMLIVPLIVSTIIVGVMSIGGRENFGRLGLKTLIYYTFTGLAAILVGLFLVNLVKPGNVSPEVAESLLSLMQGEEASGILAKTDGKDFGDIAEVFIRMVPSNIVHAAVEGQMLGLITFSLIFGFFVSKLPTPLREGQETFWNGVQEIMIMITDLVIKFAPIGVFALVTPIIQGTGFELWNEILKFFFVVVAALLIHAFGVLSLVLWLVGKVNPIKHIKTMLPVLLTAFSTSSSAATLPVTLETVEKGAGVSDKVTSFTIPLGATVNMDGTALYECVVVIFIAQVFAVSREVVDLSLTTQFTVVILALLTSIGVAGVPAASLVAVTLILTTIGIPMEAVAMIWVTDRILDMSRTAVNVYSDTVGAVVIARSEGEKTNYIS